MTLRRKTPLRKRSKRREAEDVEYRRVKRELFAAHPICQVCQSVPSCDPHHIKPLGRGGKRCDPANLLAVCRRCHDRIQRTDQQWAEQMGYLKR